MLTGAAPLLVLSLGAAQAPGWCPVPPGAALPWPGMRPAMRQVMRPALRPGARLAGGVAASAAEAAEQARRQTGGRVLAVERTGGGWQVKVLTPAGEVRVVFVPAADG